jgi:hypothetical protein
VDVKEFWEWCGFTRDKSKYWYKPNGNLFGYFTAPKIDLNNLFKYAVPKLDELGYVFTLYRFYTIKDDFKTPDTYGYGAKVYKYGIIPESSIEGIPDKDPAQALYRAICQVISSTGRNMGGGGQSASPEGR